MFGAWLGEYFMHIRDGIRQQVESRGYRTSGENWAWYLTDPLSVINGGIDRLLGNRAALSFQPLLGSGLVPAQHSLEGITGSLVPANLAGMVPLGIGIMRGNAFDLPGQRTGYTALTSAFSRAELFGIQHNVGFSLSLSW